MKPMKLPRPDSKYGHYKLPDGSIIYQSGGQEKPVNPGKWFVWYFLGFREHGSKTIKDGEVLMEHDGDKHIIIYFDTPQQALDEVNLRSKC